MPQIGQLTEDSWYLISQIFWLLIVFGAIYLVIGRSMLPKIEATVDARDRKIADDLAAAKAARDAADAAEEDYLKRSNGSRADAQALVAQAKTDASAKAATRLAAANATIEERLTAAEAEIGAARTSALAEVEAVAAEAAVALVARVSGVSVSAADASRAAKVAMTHG
jgi:F-type H+-transporting ATPase subunit b